MQIFKIIVELFMTVFVILRAKNWNRISKWERFGIALIFIALIMIMVDQYRTYEVNRQTDPQKHTVAIVR